MTKAQKIAFFKIKRLSVYIFFCALYNFYYFFSYEGVTSLYEVRSEFLYISGGFLCFFSCIYIILAFIFIVARIHFLFSSNKILIYFLLAIISLGSSFFVLENEILFLGLLALFFVFYFLFLLTLALLFKEVKMSFYFAFLCVLLAFLSFIFFDKLNLLFLFLTLHFLSFVYTFERYKILKSLIEITLKEKMSNLNPYQMFEIQRQNDFKSAKIAAWIVFISFIFYCLEYLFTMMKLLSLEYLPAIMNLLYNSTISYVLDFIIEISGISNFILIITYIFMMIKLYLLSKDKILIISNFAAVLITSLCLFLFSFSMEKSIENLFMYFAIFASFSLVIFCEFIFLKSLKKLFENKFYFILYFYLKIVILITTFIEIIYFKNTPYSLSIFLIGLSCFLFAFALSKNQNIKLSSNLKLLSNEKENI